MRRLLPTIAALALAACHHSDKFDNPNAMVNDSAPVKATAPQAVELKAADGKPVFGIYYPVTNPKALILLFHQAGSSSGEYKDIAPRLQREGYASLAIDQRIGGNLYGPNRTMAAAGVRPQSATSGPDPDFLSALPDLEGALAWAKDKAAGAPIVLWGSSYSASEVFLLAASSSAKGAVKAVLAFSPGEYFNDKLMVEHAAAKVSVPVFVTSANTVGEIDEAKPILAATKSLDRLQYVPQAGVHGSSTLNANKNPGGADENWRAVLGFLKRQFP
ncbi:MAG: alpha/beta hydrolase [Sphingomonas sp.]|uniref:alpha/beta hydrolase n=1 Tax=Sphingomonas sp. TaxID=28214 RepID=UPI001ACEC228|nr:alpha/beta hydrolase [Sphingomonas sp.]MBN8807057.1 alpha/beta hydrolase [Sphingomonas sp.]